MKLLVFICICLSYFPSAFSDCISPYKEQIKTLEGRMNPPRTTVISNTIGEGTLVGTLILATGATPITAVLALPAAAVGAGTYYASLVLKRNNLRKTMHVLRDAELGRGPALARFLRDLKIKNISAREEDEVIEQLKQGSTDQIFCEQDPDSDNYKLFTYRILVKFIRRQL